MTVQEAYEIALSLNDTTKQQDKSLEPHRLNWTNMFLQEVLVNENAIREFHHEPPLPFAPVMNDVDEVIPYHDELVTALPYWLASQIMKSDKDNVWGSRYYDMFYNRVNSVTPFIERHRDVWRDCWRCHHEH